MDYYLRLGCWGGVFAVPNQVVDDYIKLASGASLKVLLYMLRNNTQPQSDEIIASKLNLSLESVEDGFAFWEQLGIISQSPIAPEPPAAQEETVSPPPIIRETPQPTEKKARTPHHADRLTPSEIAARITKSDSLRFLFERCEAALKKPLNATEQNTLIWFTDYLGFPPEAVIMLMTRFVYVCCSFMRQISASTSAKPDIPRSAHESATVSIYLEFAFPIDAQYSTSIITASGGKPR